MCVCVYVCVLGTEKMVFSLTRQSIIIRFGHSEDIVLYSKLIHSTCLEE